MKLTTSQKIKIYIEDKERDAIIYKQLSNIVASTKSRETLFSLSQDEQNSADLLKNLYKSIKGKKYSPIVAPPELHGNFKEVILKQMLDEIDELEKYKSQIKKANKVIKSVYEKIIENDKNHFNKLVWVLLSEMNK